VDELRRHFVRRMFLLGPRRGRDLGGGERAQKTIVVVGAVPVDILRYGLAFAQQRQPDEVYRRQVLRVLQRERRDEAVFGAVDARLLLPADAPVGIEQLGPRHERGLTAGTVVHDLDGLVRRVPLDVQRLGALLAAE